MATQIKITQLTNIGSANLAATTLLPVVNMAGVPTTQKTTLGNLANVILSQSGGNYAAVGTANIAYTVANAAQPNITSVGTLTNLAVSGNVTVNGNITSNGTAYVGNLSTTGLSSITTLAVGSSANLGAVANVTITGGTAGQVLTTNGSNVLSWTTVSGGNSSYGNSDVANYLPTFTGNIGANVVTANLFSGNGTNLTNIAGANVSGFVANANVANTAFAVAGANVSGTVGNANLSQYLNVSDVNNNFSYHVVLSAGSGDKSLHIDADDNLQYNPADGTLTAVRVDATYVLADLQFSNGYPAANVTGLGNIATINLTGSNSNVLYGNGVFAAVAGGSANTGNVTFDDVTVQGNNGLNLSAGPDFTANLAYLQVRAGDVASHIHFDTGNSEAYDLIVGNDQKFVQVSSTGNILMSSYDGATTYAWNMDNTGNLTLPQSGIVTDIIPLATFDILYQYDDLVWSGNTLTFTNASSTYMLGVLALMEVGDAITLGGTSTTVTGVYTGGGAGTFTVNGTGAGQQIAQFTLPNRLTSVNGIKLTTNTKNYLFTEAGVTQSPVLTVDTLPSGQFAVAGFRAFVSDANLAPVGNFGAIVGNSGSNTVCVWCDGINWRIG
jgi:hypothetical protein